MQPGAYRESARYAKMDIAKTLTREYAHFCYRENTHANVPNTRILPLPTNTPKKTLISPFMNQSSPNFGVWYSVKDSHNGNCLLEPGNNTISPFTSKTPVYFGG